MDIHGPGTSLFQGTELNSFDNLEQREEEEEALEEQRRRDLELKNELESAFDDVSFDNDEESSVLNGSENRSSSTHSGTQSNSNHEVEQCFLKGIQGPQSISNDNSPGCPTKNFSPLKQAVRSNPVKIGDLSNEHHNVSDECRKKIQNGSLHDIVDQSGGGDKNFQSLLHYNHCFQRSPSGDAFCNGLQSNNVNNLLKPKYTEEAEDSSEQLKILYDVRVREVHRLTELVDSMRNQHKIELGDLKHQLALMMAEKERANISHSQLQSLLVDCKQQVERLVNDVNALEKAKKDLETSKRELMIEFDTAKLTIDDLQRKILVFEKGGRNKSEAEEYEFNLKRLTEKHNMELMNMKKELDTYIRKYESLCRENEELKLKVINLGQINDENLAKKSEIISRLSQQIEETQRQCENLMKLSTTEDNFRLQAELKLLKEEKLQFMSRIDNIEKEKTRLESELRQYESLSTLSLFGGSSPGKGSESKDLEGLEASGKLGAELFRALNSQKAKRLEIKSLQTQLDEKNEQIAGLIEKEKALTKEIESLKGEMKMCLSNIQENENLISLKEEESQKLQSSIQKLEEKLQIYESDFQSKLEQLEEENRILSNKLAAAEKEKSEAVNNYNEEYLRFHNEGLQKVREETEKFFKLEILKKDLENENLKKEVDELKNLYVEVCSAKESSLNLGEKERNGSGRGSAVNVEEVKRLQKELEKSRNRILELDQTLKQQYEQEVEILNLDINQLKLQLEKLKKEKDREIAEKDRILVENELLKMEIEQITSDKNLLFLDHEKLVKEAEELRENVEKLKESAQSDLESALEKHALELQNLSNQYEITVKKLKREIESTMGKTVKCESRHTSPIKSWTKNAATQGSSSVPVDKSTSPMQEKKTTPVTGESSSRLLKDTSALTDPEPVTIPKKEVVDIMKKLGAHHEQEIMTLEKKYSSELMKLQRRFHLEVDKAKEVIYRELRKEHQYDLEQLEEKHRIELENRIEQEKKEAVVELITEWVAEVQSLKTSYAQSQAEIEKMKMKYKAAKNVALQYKTYFKSKSEHMKEEWKRIEDGYERALRELEKNVHILVDVKEDEVKAKVESITKLYEQKINKMKEKLSKCEGKLKAEKGGSGKRGESYKPRENFDLKRDLERLSVPDGSLCPRLSPSQKPGREELLGQCKRLLEARGEEGEELGVCLKKEEREIDAKSRGQKKHQPGSGDQTNRERTKR